LRSQQFIQDSFQDRFDVMQEVEARVVLSANEDAGHSVRPATAGPGGGRDGVAFGEAPDDVAQPPAAEFVSTSESRHSRQTVCGRYADTRRVTAEQPLPVLTSLSRSTDERASMAKSLNS
jgi:hypothetical protein